MTQERVKRELEHFTMLDRHEGMVWWGHLRPAGIKRLERRAAILREWFGVHPEGALLEIGAGDGVLTKYLAGWQQSVTATELSPLLLNKAQQSINASNITFKVADVEHLPFENNSFDGILGNSILHHLDLSICLREIFRTLKSGGRIIFFEPNLLNPQIFLEKKISFIGKRLQNSPDEIAFTRWKLKQTLENAGFRSIMIQPFDFIHPSIPKFLISTAEKVGNILECVPFFREFAGSLIIKAQKP
jgi:ubiquinone/menaquinone biosynthesis C-methylase UbiE